MTVPNWHRLPDCREDELLIRGVCYHCGGEEPRPVLDFENGYSDEFNDSESPRSWAERANMRVLTWRDMRRIFSRADDKLHAYSMRASPMLQAMTRTESS